MANWQTPVPVRFGTTMSDTRALVVIDVQYDFMPGGALAVADGDAIVPIINALASQFATVVLTQDWHPAQHVSFACNHPGQAPFGQITLPYGEQVLWPAHCVQDSPGARLHTGLRIPHAQLILRKGCQPQIDSYSAFVEADRKTTTGLAAWLKARGIHEVYLCGLATDYCVAWSALDARAAGFETWLIEDACRAIDLDGSLARALAELDDAGVHRISSTSLCLGENKRIASG